MNYLLFQVGIDANTSSLSWRIKKRKDILNQVAEMAESLHQGMIIFN
jgi:hypothetical protein